MDLFPGLGDDEIIVENTLEEEELMEVVMSQETSSRQSEFTLSDG